MSKRKLCALGYPASDRVDSNGKNICHQFRWNLQTRITTIADEGTFRKLVVWLEDQKIRHYNIKERAELENVQSSDWNSAFEKAPVCFIVEPRLLLINFQYLNDLSCPFAADKTPKAELLDWLLGLAVSMNYSENGSSVIR